MSESDEEEARRFAKKYDIEVPEEEEKAGPVLEAYPDDEPVDPAEDPEAPIKHPGRYADSPPDEPSRHKKK